MTDDEILATDEFREYAKRRARAFLIHVKSTYLTVATIRSELAEIDAAFDGVRGIDYSAQSVSGTPSGDGVARLVERKESLKAEYEAELMECLQLQADAHRALRGVSEPSRSALTLHYLEGLTWTDVGERTGYSVDHVRGYLADRGLAELFPHIPREHIPEAFWD